MTFKSEVRSARLDEMVQEAVHSKITECITQWNLPELVEYFQVDKNKLPPSILNVLSDYGDERQVLQLLRGLLETIEVARQDPNNLIVFLSRKMACLYWALRNAGLQSEGVPVATDRFALLGEVDTWNDKRVLVRDDMCITGFSIGQRTNRILSRVSDAAVDARSFVNGRQGEMSADAHSAYLERARKGITRVLARAGIPYFTDFPVSEQYQCNVVDFEQWLRSIDAAHVDVTNEALAGMPCSNYSLNLNALVSASAAHRYQLETSHAIKLRVFTWQQEDTVTVRLMPKIIFKPLKVSTLREAASTLNINLPMKDDLEVLKQLFGYLEYLAAASIFDLIPRLPGANTQPRIEQGFMKFVLGDLLYARYIAGNNKELAFIQNLSPTEWAHPEASPAQAPDDYNGLHDSDIPTASPWAISDAEIHLLAASIIRKGRTREERTAFHSLPAALTNPIITALALDILNDEGLVVPDQKMETIAGELYIARSYRRGENSTLPSRPQENSRSPLGLYAKVRIAYRIDPQDNLVYPLTPA